MKAGSVRVFDEINFLKTKVLEVIYVSIGNHLCFSLIKMANIQKNKNNSV